MAGRIENAERGVFSGPADDHLGLVAESHRTTRPSGQPVDIGPVGEQPPGMGQLAGKLSLVGHPHQGAGAARPLSEKQLA